MKRNSFALGAPNEEAPIWQGKEKEAQEDWFIKEEGMEGVFIMGKIKRCGCQWIQYLCDLWQTSAFQGASSIPLHPRPEDFNFVFRG